MGKMAGFRITTVRFLEWRGGRDWLRYIHVPCPANEGSLRAPNRLSRREGLQNTSLYFALRADLRSFRCAPGASVEPDVSSHHPLWQTHQVAIGPLMSLAEREGFEPPDRGSGQRFSRPPHSTTLPPLLIQKCFTTLLVITFFNMRRVPPHYSVLPCTSPLRGQCRYAPLFQFASLAP